MLCVAGSLLFVFCGLLFCCGFRVVGLCGYCCYIALMVVCVDLYVVCFVVCFACVNTYLIVLLALVFVFDVSLCLLCLLLGTE